jgi:hypothetical protein
MSSARRTIPRAVVFAAALTLSAACASSDPAPRPATSASTAPTAQADPALVASYEDDVRAMAAAFEKGRRNIGAYPSNINKIETLPQSLGVTLSGTNHVEAYELAPDGDSYTFTITAEGASVSATYDSTTESTELVRR